MKSRHLKCSVAVSTHSDVRNKPFEKYSHKPA